MNPTALIAEDEPLLAADLQAELKRLWPQLRIVANVAHGQAALEQGLALLPDVLFLDIRMPGLTGLDAAIALAEDWPEGRPLPLTVFVTAYDQYAVQAFERSAVDYILKPVQPERLAQTCARLRSALSLRAQGGDSMIAQLHDQLRGLLGAAAGTAPQAPLLRVLQVSTGNTIIMVPIDSVLYFEAADKYVRVITATREHLVRMSLRELQPRLDPARFWQIHRGTIVCFDAVASALRTESGKVTLTLHGHAQRLGVSRLHAHLFAGM